MNERERTHWLGCWRDHLECAKAKVVRQQKELDRLRKREREPASPDPVERLACRALGWATVALVLVCAYVVLEIVNGLL